jgi:parallel beta-helix repeat protein
MIPLLASLVINASAYPSLPDAVDACDGVDCTVIAPSGYYPISRPITPKSHTRIIGEGTAVIEPTDTMSAFSMFGSASGTATIVGASAEETNVLTVSDGSSFAAGGMVALLSADGWSDQVGVVAAVIGNQLVLKNRLGMSVPDGTAIQPVQPIEGVEIDNLSVTGGGRTLLAYYVKDLVLRDISSSNTDGIMVFYSAGTAIYGTYTTGCQYGLYVGWADSPLLVANTLYHSYRGNVVFGNANNGLVAGNSIDSDQTANSSTGLSGDGVSFGNVWNTTILSNTVANSSCYGMWIKDSNHNLIAKNIVNNSFAAGMFLDGSSGNTLYGNQFLSIAAEIGLVADGGSGNVVADETFNGNYQAMALFRTSGTSLINNVLMADSSPALFGPTNVNMTLLRNAVQDAQPPVVGAQLVCSDL